MADPIERAEPKGRGATGPRLVVTRVVVATLAAGLLVFAAVGTAPAGRDSIDSMFHADPTDSPHVLAKQFDCLGRRLAERLPPGSVVAIGDLQASGSDLLWRQRLTELAFPVARITDDVSAATQVITVAPSDSPDSCFGFELTIEPRAG